MSEAIKNNALTESTREERIRQYVYSHICQAAYELYEITLEMHATLTAGIITDTEKHLAELGETANRQLVGILQAIKDVRRNN
jgi:hypothetical protein